MTTKERSLRSLTIVRTAGHDYGVVLSRTVDTRVITIGNERRRVRFQSRYRDMNDYLVARMGEFEEVRVRVWDDGQVLATADRPLTVEIAAVQQYRAETETQ